MNLTPRQKEILPLIAEGKSGPEIGEALFMSPHTVACHVVKIRALLGAKNTAHAIHLAHVHGLLGRTEG